MATRDLQIAIGFLRKQKSRVRTVYVQRLAQLAGDTYQFLIDRSPVFSGAYRASHQVYVGRELAYDPPGRPPPDVRFKERDLFGPPDAHEVERSVVAAAGSRGNIRFVNRRFYAKWLEFGTAKLAPRRIYGFALDFARQRARELKVRSARGGVVGRFQEVDE